MTRTVTAHTPIKCLECTRNRQIPFSGLYWPIQCALLDWWHGITLKVIIHTMNASKRCQRAVVRFLMKVLVKSIVQYKMYVTGSGRSSTSSRPSQSYMVFFHYENLYNIGSARNTLRTIHILHSTIDFNRAFIFRW